MSAKRDANVYQHMLRQCREAAAKALGANCGASTSKNYDVLDAALLQALIELEVLADLLEQRDQADVTHYFVRGIMDRLSFAKDLGDGLFDPDRPYVACSATEYHPDGIEAGMKAAREGGAAQ